MGWLAFSALAAVVVIVALGVWRKWIAPWKDARELADAVVAQKPPRKVLISGNPEARRVGLALEELMNCRREFETRVRESESNVQTVLGAMLDGLAVIDDRRNVRLMNREFRSMFGVGENVAGGTILELVHNAAVDRLASDALRGEQPRRGSVELVRGGAEPRELEVSAVPLGENSADMKGAVILFRDVSPFGKVETMRRDFVANVSHELRTPLSIFRGYLETLLDEPQLAAAERERILRVLQKHSSRLNSLVDDLLSLARLEAPDTRLKLAPVDLREFV